MPCQNIQAFVDQPLDQEYRPALFEGAVHSGQLSFH